MIRSIRTFIPWIAFLTLATRDDWRYAALAGFALSLGLLVLDLRARRGADELVLEISGTVFFGLLAGYAQLSPDSAFKAYGPALAVGWLALTAWGSILIGKPFTLGIARHRAPESVWHTPRFLRTNVVITAVWAASFTVSAAVQAVVLHQSAQATGAVVAVKIISFVLPVLFTIRYARRAARA